MDPQVEVWMLLNALVPPLLSIIDCHAELDTAPRMSEACLRWLCRVDAGEGRHAASVHSVRRFDDVGALGLPEDLPEVHHRNHPGVNCRGKEGPRAHRR